MTTDKQERKSHLNYNQQQHGKRHDQLHTARKTANKDTKPTSRERPRNTRRKTKKKIKRMQQVLLTRRQVQMGKNKREKMHNRQRMKSLHRH